jgi:hypothetical protein
MLKASSKRTQVKWISRSFRLIKGANRCISNAENLIKQNKRLRLVEGKTRLNKRDKWGDHFWCITPRGNIIDPYFMFRFPTEWKDIEYKFPYIIPLSELQRKTWPPVPQIKNYSTISDDEIMHLINSDCFFGRKFNRECISCFCKSFYINSISTATY